MVTRINYWGNSKFADWIRKLGGIPPKLKVGTSKEWNEYHKTGKAKNKFVYWLADDGLDMLQDFVNWPMDKLDNFAYWIKRRFISPSHLINTRLSKGDWHETEEKILHGMFEELIDFVEQQKASMNVWCTEKDKRPWYRNYLPYFIGYLVPIKSQQLGIEYLLWEINLKKDDEWFGYSWREKEEGKETIDKERAENPEYMKPTHQALAALEILELYVWWKFIRPMRQDPMDESGYTDYFKKKREGKEDLFDILDDDNKTPKDKANLKKISDKWHKLEEAQFKEDTNMMIRLVNIRQSLWT